MRYKTRKRLAMLILLVGLPLWIIAAWALLGALERPPIWVELLVYVALGMVWAFPFKFIFKGVGKDEPDKTDPQ